MVKNKRDEEVRRMREQGKTLEEIAKSFGISRQRVSQITKNKEETTKAPFDGKLSTRTWHSLCRSGVENKGQLLTALENGIPVYNIGNKGKKEIADYLGRNVVFGGKQIEEVVIHGIKYVGTTNKRILKYG